MNKESPVPLPIAIRRMKEEQKRKEQRDEMNKVQFGYHDSSYKRNEGAFQDKHMTDAYAQVRRNEQTIKSGLIQATSSTPYTKDIEVQQRTKNINRPKQLKEQTSEEEKELTFDFIAEQLGHKRFRPHATGKTRWGVNTSLHQLKEQKTHGTKTTKS